MRATPLPQVQAASWGRSQRLTLFLSTEKVAAQPVQLPGRKRAKVKQGSAVWDCRRYRNMHGCCKGSAWRLCCCTCPSLPFLGGLGTSSPWRGHATGGASTALGSTTPLCPLPVQCQHWEQHRSHTAELPQTAPAPSLTEVVAGAALAQALGQT